MNGMCVENLYTDKVFFFYNQPVYKVLSLGDYVSKDFLT